jgi:Zn-dependent membrane protease YugP
MSEMSNMFAGIGMIILVVLLVIVGPLATIWALNTLFPILAIPFNFDTWVAALVLMSVVRSNVRKESK